MNLSKRRFKYLAFHPATFAFLVGLMGFTMLVAAIYLITISA